MTSTPSSSGTPSNKITTAQLQGISSHQFLNAKIVNVQSLTAGNNKLKTATGIK